jgi:uncharacterized protein (TIGR00369 family)
LRSVAHALHAPSRFTTGTDYTCKGRVVTINLGSDAKIHPVTGELDAGVNQERGIAIAEFLGLRAADEHPADTWVGVMVASPQTLNMRGLVHGGATATLIDWAAGWGALHLTGCAGVTTDMFIRYVAVAREDSTLRAATTIDRVGRSMISMTVRVTDDTERLVAIGNVGYNIMERRA